MNKEIDFNKYKLKGAYHWEEYEGNLFKINSYTSARYDIVIDHLINLGLSTTDIVLDYGCGDGALAGAIYKNIKCKILGLDTEDNGIDLAKAMFVRHNYSGEFRKFDGYYTSLSDDSIDAVVCSDVIEHVNYPDKLLIEIKRILKPGGHLIITTPIKFTEDPLDKMHVQEWYPKEFKKLCSRVFKNVVKATKSHPIIWYELINANNKWVNRFGRLSLNIFTKLGINLFKQSNSNWRCFTTQVLLLKK